MAGRFRRVEKTSDDEGEIAPVRIVDHGPPAGTAFAIDQLPVQKQEVGLIFVPELPRDMVPLIVVDEESAVGPADLIDVVAGGPTVGPEEAGVRNAPSLGGPGVVDPGGDQAEVPSSTHPIGHPDSLVISPADIPVPILFRSSGVADPGLYGPFPGASPKLQLGVVDGADPDVGVVLAAAESGRGSKTGPAAPQGFYVRP